MTSITSKGTTFLYGDEDYTVSTPGEVASKLQEKGVASLPGVLSTAECDGMNEGMWDTIELLTSGLETPTDRTKPSTYRSVFDLNPLHGGLFQHHGWGHAQYVWDVRQNPRVAASYADIYKCDASDLLVSFDGVNASLGSNLPSGKGQFRGRSWLHLDQRLSDSRFLCVQSWVTANDILPGDATLRFLSGSHKLHAEFSKAFSLTEFNKDWFMLKPEHIEWYKERGCVDTCITAQAGTQVFWDSRTVHSGVEYLPLEDCPKRSKPREVRNVVYVCYQPRKQTTLNLRKSILTPGHKFHLRMASHWPNQMKLFPKRPRQYGPPPKGCHQTDPTQYWSFVPPLPDPKLTAFGRCIAGLD